MSTLSGRPEPAVPRRSDYGDGVYRRRIRLDATAQRAEAQLEDDFHHFAAGIEHDGARVTAVRARAYRWPWTTCPGALAPLERLVGLPLSAGYKDAARRADPRAQCTHLLDAAQLAVAHGRRHRRGPGGRRTYDCEVPDWRDGSTVVRLLRDGQPLLGWRLERDGIGEVLEGPADFAGKPLQGVGFLAFVGRSLDPELAEAALVLRRAAFIGRGRVWDFDAVRRAASFAPTVGAACFTFHPERQAEALRVQGSLRVLGAVAPDELAAEPSLFDACPEAAGR